MSTCTKQSFAILPLIVAVSEDSVLDLRGESLLQSAAASADLEYSYRSLVDVIEKPDPGAVTIGLGPCSRLASLAETWLSEGQGPLMLLATEDCDGSSRDYEIQTKDRLFVALFNALLTPRRLAREYVECSAPPLPVPRVLPDGLTREEQLLLGRQYLNGRHLTIVTINRPPFMILDVQTIGSEQVIVGPGEGFCIEMIKTLAKKYHFNYTLELPYDGNWGNAMPNGTFNGMVGMVVREWADMAMGSFTITEAREAVIDFTHPFYEEPTAILIRAPGERPNTLAFLQPFTYKVWLLILSSPCAVGPLLWLMTEGTGDWSPSLYPHKGRSASVLNYVWGAGFCLIAQGYELRLNESSRVMLGLWWTYCMILIYTYTGNLIAFLTVPRLAGIIQSLDELANQREILWTYRAETAHEKLFGGAESGTYRKIGDLMRSNRGLMVTSDVDGINAVLLKNMAFIKEKSSLDTAMEQDYLQTKKCRLTLVPQLFFSASFGWALQEDSVFLPVFNAEILRMMQSGLFREWQVEYWPKPNECTAVKDKDAQGPRPLRLRDLGGHFIVLGLGCSVALVALLLELWYRRRSLPCRPAVEEPAKPSKYRTQLDIPLDITK
ncbi:glutamate receptor U1 [Hyalella azteca]|uniref:Glutamate receptor U1 n=1 Tax=Hyalella azteca TaxID=294128 RepID=A0A979FNY4_HYAAZ|nr:glutamate receptor U1 [Hyalella azteca]